MTKSLPNKVHLKQRLYYHHLAEGLYVINHISIFKEIVVVLKTMEVKYDDEDLGLILLCSLPPSYTTFQHTLLYSSDALTLDEVYEVIRSKKTMKQLVGRPKAKC